MVNPIVTTMSKLNYLLADVLALVTKGVELTEALKQTGVSQRTWAASLARDAALAKRFKRIDTARAPTYQHCLEMVLGIAAGERLQDLCVEYGVGRLGFFSTLDNHDDLQQRYNSALRSAADTLVEQTLGIADTEATYVDQHGNTRSDATIVPQLKLRIDTRQWIASRTAPHIYDTKHRVELSAGKDAAITVEIKRFGDEDSTPT